MPPYLTVALPFIGIGLQAVGDYLDIEVLLQNYLPFFIDTWATLCWFVILPAPFYFALRPQAFDISFSVILAHLLLLEYFVWYDSGLSLVENIVDRITHSMLVLFFTIEVVANIPIRTGMCPIQFSEDG
ncbi:hypothetical protein BDY21DRAFT_368751 [Lineolata rhizophorae]|uniref:Uncharacterized protein n=1 Tax=Lineolata rhizophorae TaxID=578093 RepID=A0A6A6PC86_9PEZI|nr:hypothetical protein BDY21DRAFT_368751 [Lineolata rhizophorae]